MGKTDAAALDKLHAILALLHLDAFDARLETHKLTGRLKGSWACSAGYDLRVVFKFIERDKKQCILLQSLGTHDDVY